MPIQTLNNRILLDCQELLTCGISKSVFIGWRRDTRCIGEWETINGVLYIYEDSIPPLSRTKIPSAKKLQKQYESQKATQKLFDKLKCAYAFEHTKYKEIYEAVGGLKAEQKTRCAQFHAVYQCLFDRRKEEKTNDLQNEYEAFNRLLPGVSGSKHDFSRRLKKCLTGGIKAVALDSRSFGNHNEDTATKIDKPTRLLTFELTADEMKYSAAEMLQRIEVDCLNRGAHVPSLTWVQDTMREALTYYHVIVSRYGEQEAKKRMPFASLDKPKYANMLHMIDGYKVPAYFDGWKSLTLVYVLDVCSKKITGLSIGENETGVEILEALRNSVSTTGFLPNELVMDKHTWTRTQEFGNIKLVHERNGCTIKETRNPQEKSDIERLHPVLEKRFKDYGVWHGGNITAKNINTRIKKEALKPSKLTKDELISICACVVNDWNTLPGNDGLTPNQRYEATAHPSPITVSIYDQALLFAPQLEKKVSRNQINIEKNGVLHEFQLPAALWQPYNGKQVWVSYEDLTDCIYVFDLHTKEALAVVKPKEIIHADNANQTEDDIKKLFRQKGKTEGIIADSARKLEKLKADAVNVDADVFARIDKARMPKDAVKVLEENGMAKKYAEQMGADTSTLFSKQPTLSKLPDAFYPKKKRDDQVFTPKSHTITKLDLNDLLSDD